MESQRRCQYLTNTFGCMGMLGIESAIVMTMQQSLTKMKTIAACEQAVPCLREVTHKWQAKQDTVTGSGKDGESYSFPLPLIALLLACAFVCHLKWRGCSQSITFLGNFARSVFSESVYIRNSKEKFVHVSLFTHFKQHLTITLRHSLMPDSKSPDIRVI